MDLALIWAIIIAFSVLAYVLLDGFDLGVGIVFPLLANETEKKTAINTIVPVWDGNETWLVLGGGGLFAAFPLAYSTLLTALYAPVIAMLLALVFRGVSMEYREKSKQWRPFWNLGFCVGSTVAALCQGIMLGAFIQGIQVVDRTYVGGWYDWLTPFSFCCGLAIVFGYALLGSSWLTMKTEANLHFKMQKLITPLTITVFLFIVALSTWTPYLDERLYVRWFTWPNILVLAPIPLLVVVITLLLIRHANNKKSYVPFLLAEGLFMATFAGFGISTYPYIVPHQVTIWEAAGPDSSLWFLLVGTLVLLPIIVVYTAHSYWVFRGKVNDDRFGYH